MTNAQIADLFRNVAASYTITDEKKYRFQIIAYQKAADTIEGTTDQIRDVLRDDTKASMPGIGTTMRDHLEELITTGHVKHFDEVMKDIPKALFPLLKVPSLGPKKAYKLVTAYHLENPKTVLDDIEKIAKEGKIAKLESFGEKSQSDILRAIGEYRLGFGKTTRMVLPYAAELADKMISYLKSSPDVVDAEPLGSLRRMKATVGDIDIAVTAKNSKAVMEHFVHFPNKERVVEQGDTTATILAAGGKQIDLMIMPPESFGSLLQHFSGSKEHNVHLRELALKKGLSLSEYGIKKKDDPKEKTKQYKSEEDFYHALGMDWIPPEMRENTGEIELALAHKLPKVVELKDIRGDLHIHSSFPIEPSHDLGIDPIEDMVKKAISLGYEYLGFSEHNPSVSKHTESQMYDLLSRRQETIEKLNQKYKQIKLMSLMETDILANGKLGLDEKSLSLLDAILVSIHSVFSLSKKDMTKRILEGFSHPKAKILSHPTGRLLNERPGYEIDLDEILAFAKKHDKALEINAWPQRLDLPDTMVREAVKQGVKMSIDTDSHAVAHMENMRFGVAVARRGWATPGDIINTLPYNRLIHWLRDEGR